MLDFHVDPELCTKCELCVQDCPPHTIAMSEEGDGLPVIVKEERCIRCQHCLAICPTGAVSILGCKPEDSAPRKEFKVDAQSLGNFYRGRRSVRSYKDDDVDQALLQKLLDDAWHAPTGVNAQPVLFTVINSHESVGRLRDEVYARLATELQKEAVAATPKAQYMSFTLRAREKFGDDVIFRGAPGILLASCPKGGASPIADPIIALSYFDILAQAAGLGTLWNGLIKWTVNDILPDLRSRLGVPDDHQLGYAMSFGVPAVKYQRTVQRGAARVQWAKV